MKTKRQHAVRLPHEEVAVGKASQECRIRDKLSDACSLMGRGNLANS